jgi:hypothetical protein
MSGKNDRIILAGMIVLGVIFIALVGAAIGIGTFIYLGGPTATPTPAPTSTPAPSATPVPTTAPAVGQNPFYIDRLITDRAERTYTLQVALADGAQPVDMSKVSAELISGNETYPAWDYFHTGHSWSMGSDGDAFLDHGERFTMNIYAPQAGLPWETEAPVKMILLVDSVPVFTFPYVAAV